MGPSSYGSGSGEKGEKGGENQTCFIVSGSSASSPTDAPSGWETLDVVTAGCASRQTALISSIYVNHDASDRGLS